jgi:hypothetical protein
MAEIRRFRSASFLSIEGCMVQREILFDQ